MTRKKDPEKRDATRKMQLRKKTPGPDAPSKDERRHLVGKGSVFDPGRVFVIHTDLNERAKEKLDENIRNLKLDKNIARLLRTRWLHTSIAISAVRSSKPKGLLIDLLIPAARAEDCRLELDKGYERWVEKYGSKRAGRMFAWHSAVIVVGYWIEWARKRLNLLKIFSSN
jgi:hypothetical protein